VKEAAVIDLFSEEMRRDPYPVYGRLRAAAPVLHEPGSGLWMLLDYAGVWQALNDHDAFSSRAAPKGGALDWLIFFDPPRHTKLRALVSRAFTPRSVAALEPRIRELSRELLDQAVERGEMDLAADYAFPLPQLVIAEMLDVPAADRPRFRRWNDVVLDMIHTAQGGAEADRAVGEFRAAVAEIGAYLAGQLQERRAAPRDDLLTRLVEAEVDGERLTEKDIVSFFQLLLVAGSETTTNLITNAVLCLLENPDQLARLRAAPELLPSAIEEVLRYRSPLQAVFRQTRRDVALHGQVIPADRLVFVMVGSANRDPRQFPDADRFDIARDPNPHVGFGHGPHFCLGAPLARLEARVALTDLLGRLRGLARADGGPWEPRRAFHVHGPARLPVHFAPGRRAGG
jgi:cytochrome P450